MPTYEADAWGYLWVTDITLHASGKCTPVALIAGQELDTVLDHYRTLYKDELQLADTKWFRMAHKDYLYLKDGAFLRATRRYVETTLR